MFHSGVARYLDIFPGLTHEERQNPKMQSPASDRNRRWKYRLLARPPRRERDQQVAEVDSPVAVEIGRALALVRDPVAVAVLVPARGDIALVGGGQTLRAWACDGRSCHCQTGQLHPALRAPPARDARQVVTTSGTASKIQATDRMIE